VNGLDPQLVQAVLAGWRTAPAIAPDGRAWVSDRLRTVLGFLEKLTLSPAEIGPADIEPMRLAGVSDKAIEEALYVCFLFNVLDRLADSFDFPQPSTQVYSRIGKFLYDRGYGTSSIPG
jgi:alkylhydroperoxidase family enzyme